MSRRVGRPSKPYVRTAYSEPELRFIYELVKKTDNKELKEKLRHDLKERKRLSFLYERAKERLFKNNP